MAGLDRDLVEKLRLMFHTSGWKEVMQPALTRRVQVLKDLTFSTPSERPEPYKSMDDVTATSVLRGEVRATEWVLHAFTNDIEVSDFHQQREELLRQVQNGGKPAAPEPANPV